MELNEIIDEIFDIAIAIGYNNISHFHPLLVSAKNKSKPEDLLIAVAAPLKQKITNGIPLSKAELKAVLKTLKEIAKNYDIKELKKPIQALEVYLNSLS